MSIQKMAGIIGVMRNCHQLQRRFTDAELDKLATVIAPEEYRVEQMLRQRVAWLPMTDLIP